MSHYFPLAEKVCLSINAKISNTIRKRLWEAVRKTMLDQPRSSKTFSIQGHNKMFSYHNFNDVFAFNPECSYEDETIHSIGVNRSKLEGLFIEKVMKLMGIKRRRQCSIVI